MSRLRHHRESPGVGARWPSLHFGSSDAALLKDDQNQPLLLPSFFSARESRPTVLSFPTQTWGASGGSRLTGQSSVACSSRRRRHPERMDVMQVEGVVEGTARGFGSPFPRHLISAWSQTGRQRGRRPPRATSFFIPFFAFLSALERLLSR